MCGPVDTKIRNKILLFSLCAVFAIVLVQSANALTYTQSILCESQGQWVSCSSLQYGAELTGIQAVCNSTTGIPFSVPFIEASIIHYDMTYHVEVELEQVATNTYQNTSLSQFIDSGAWGIRVSCVDPSTNPAPLCTGVGVLPGNPNQWLVPFGEYFIINKSNFQVTGACCTDETIDNVTITEILEDSFDKQLYIDKIQQWRPEQLEEGVSCSITHRNDCQGTPVLGITANGVSIPNHADAMQVLCCNPKMAVSVAYETCIGDLEPVAYLSDMTDANLAYYSDAGGGFGYIEFDSTDGNYPLTICAAPLDMSQTMQCILTGGGQCGGAFEGPHTCLYEVNNEGELFACGTNVNYGRVCCYRS